MISTKRDQTLYDVANAINRLVSVSYDACASNYYDGEDEDDSYNDSALFAEEQNLKDAVGALAEERDFYKKAADVFADYLANNFRYSDTSKILTLIEQAGFNKEIADRLGIEWFYN